MGQPSPSSQLIVQQRREEAACNLRGDDVLSEEKRERASLPPLTITVQGNYRVEWEEDNREDEEV